MQQFDQKVSLAFLAGGFLIAVTGIRAPDHIITGVVTLLGIGIIFFALSNLVKATKPDPKYDFKKDGFGIPRTVSTVKLIFLRGLSIASFIAAACVWIYHWVSS